ncbi:hypothetical protein WICMUC_002496 [Wickerhamomyces mucosus]|uniref:NAD-dependent epimerase/dehydratase domain-containing protein n=1 Tax=Wickerhamomyces mucosus TaxID=1378264 RepID=A0A9P8PQJ2_9ASCO|nr:hypothetical protein WICMUC_002496 [Wickerhamomyces mucosus]
MVKYFVTGGSGFIGSKVIKFLIEDGDEVLALARSDESATKLEKLGAKVLKGDLSNIEILKEGATETDGVLHLGFIHDFQNFENSAKTDRAAIEAFAQVLKQTNKPLVISSGALSLAQPIGLSPLDEHSKLPDSPFSNGPFGIRTETANYVASLKDQGIRSSIVRLSPIVHGPNDHAFIVILSQIAQKNGFAGYIDEGNNQWTGVHVDDAARLHILAAKKGIAGHYYHGVSSHDQTKDIASAIGEKYKIPIKSLTLEEAKESIGFLSTLFAANLNVSIKYTKEELGWEPKEIGLIEDYKLNY